MRPPPGLNASEYTEDLQAEEGKEFVSYDVQKGIWVYKVENFDKVEPETPAATTK
jgi:hypothetical protein